MAFEFYYWSGIQGRGEFVRLALEQAGADYRDVAREKGDAAVAAMMRDAETPPFAPPFLKDGDIVVGQTAAILLHLGDRLDLAPKEPRLRLWTHQIQLTIADFVVESHDTHHPLGPGRYYEEQKAEAAVRSREFRAERVPKFLRWFETVMERNGPRSGWLVGDSLSYADLSLFQMVGGLSYAFPVLMKQVLADYPRVAELHERVSGQPNVAAYLKSERRIPFNEDGIFRHYPALDA